jgi:undecaprenyl-diphosphatase
MLADRRRGVVVALVLLAACAALMLLVGRRPPSEAPASSFAPIGRLDAVVDSWASGLGPGPVRSLSGVLDVLGLGALTAAIRGAGTVALALHRAWDRLAAFVATWIATEGAIEWLKDAFHRGRPGDPAVAVAGFALPSGHAVRGAAVALAFAYAFAPPARRRPWLVAAGAFAALMALARVALRAHWLSDVVAGSLLGAGVATLAAALATARRPPT